MATKQSTQDLQKLVINKVPDLATFRNMESNNQINADELYLIEEQDIYVKAVTTGTANGNINVQLSDGTTQSVHVYGLGTNAYTSTAFAPLNSPALTGTPTAPTPTTASGGTSIATKDFVESSFSYMTAANAVHAGSAGYATEAKHASSADYASSAKTAAYAVTAAWARYAASAGYTNSAGSAGYALSSNYAAGAGTAGYAASATYAGSAAYAAYAINSANASSAGFATNATNSKYATTASWALTAAYAITAGNAVKATQDADGNIITSTYATKTELNQLLANNDAMVFKGTLGTGGTITSVPANGYQAGHTYRVITAGTYAGQKCEVGDLLIAVADGPTSGTTVTNAHWTVAQTNIDGAVTTSQTSSTSGSLAIFTGTAGKTVIKAAQVGSATKPIYIDANGVPQTITSYEGKSNYAGTADFAINANSAKGASSAAYALNASSASFATRSNCAGFATYAACAQYSVTAYFAGTSGFAIQANCAAHATHAGTATYAASAGYSKFAGTSTFAIDAKNSSFAGTATWAVRANTSNFAIQAGSASFATNASKAAQADSADYSTLAGMATSASEAVHAMTSAFAASAAFAQGAAFAAGATTADNAATAGRALHAASAGYAKSATWATCAGFSTSANWAGSAGYAIRAASAGWAASANWAGSAAYAAAVGPHSHSEIVTIGDKRSVATTPNDYSNKISFAGLKNKATVGSPSNDTYSYVVGLRGWSDPSGGDSHELAFNNTGVFWRHGASSTWGNWAQVVVNTGSWAISVASSTWASSAGYAKSATWAASAGYAASALQATHAVSAGWAVSATWAASAGYARSATWAASAGYAQSATWAKTASYAASAGYAQSATWAASAGYARSATWAKTASYAASATWAKTASYAASATWAASAGYAEITRFLGPQETGFTILTDHNPLGTTKVIGSADVPGITWSNLWQQQWRATSAVFTSATTANAPITDKAQFGIVASQSTNSNNFYANLYVDGNMIAQNFMGKASSAEYATNAASAGWATNTASASWARNAASASWATSANWASSAGYAAKAKAAAITSTTYSVAYYTDAVGSFGSNTNLQFNPTLQIFSIGGSISATGDLTITGNANLNGQTYADSLTAGSLLVSGAANFIQIPTAPTPAATSNDTSIATTAFVKANRLANTNTGAADRPIYITGNAPTATTYRMSGTNTTATTARPITDNLETGNWYVNGTNNGELFNQSDGVAYVEKYSDAWIHEIYGDYRTGQIAVRGKNNGTWTSWRKILDSTNYTDYTVTKTGTGAAGTWGISITGTSNLAKGLTPISDASGITTTGLVYAKGQLTIGTSANNAVEGSNANYQLWSYPTNGTAINGGASANIQNIRAYWGTTYFRDIFISPNNSRIYHRAVNNNVAEAWRVLVQSNVAGVGGTTTPVYVNSDGNVTALNYTISKSVPSDAVFTDTKNTAGSTQSASKLFMIGATSQAANPQTYSNTAVYATAGAFAATSYKVAEHVTMQYNTATYALDFIFA